MAGYSASKAAAHSITQALRAELRDQGITVLGAYPGGIDTDMIRRAPHVPAARAILRRGSPYPAGLLLDG
jgi:NAD(P)-dependent dehydrogenase (short-subunit alcohol dehydrogenase family)